VIEAGLLRRLVRRDVLVVPEDVGRVVDALQRLQARVVLVAVRLADAVHAVVGAEVVDVDSVLGVRLERVPEAARPT
jgi:orotate phosphoribosyltransferase-like protein